MTGPEPDHNGWEWVEDDDQCGSCGHTNKECECSSEYMDDPDEPPVSVRRF